MQKNTEKPLAMSLVILGGLARMAQHWNFAPVGALSLFAGARMRGWKAYALPLALMAITDPFLGGYSFATPFVYASFVLSVWIGTRLRSTENPAWIGAATLAGSVQFFLITNFPTWLGFHGTYPHTLGGLGACYLAAIPFFRHTALADLLYTAVFFSLHFVLSRTVVHSERVAPQTA